MKRVIPALLFFVMVQITVTAQILLPADDTKQFVTMKITDAAQWNNIVNGNVPVEKLLKTFYKGWQDKYDFVFFIVNQTNSYQTQYYSKVNYSTPQKGSPAFKYADTTLSFLRGVMVFPNRWQIAFGATLHEFAHNWANSILPTWAVVDPRTSTVVPVGNQQFITVLDAAGKAIKSKYYKNQDGSFRDSVVYNSNASHWGISTVNGQLGGFSEANLVYNAATQTYSVKKSFGWNNTGGNSMPYSFLELYLMGFATKEELTNIQTFEDITNYKTTPDTIWSPVSANGSRSYSIQNLPSFKATKKTYTSDDLQKLSASVREPIRLPGFAVAFVLLTQNDVSEAEKAEVKTQIEWFTAYNTDEAFAGVLKKPNGVLMTKTDMENIYNFYEATLKRGKIAKSPMKDMFKK
jgi:hypothetical protein